MPNKNLRDTRQCNQVAANCHLSNEPKCLYSLAAGSVKLHWSTAVIWVNISNRLTMTTPAIWCLSGKKENVYSFTYLIMVWRVTLHIWERTFKSVESLMNVLDLSSQKSRSTEFYTNLTHMSSTIKWWSDTSWHPNAHRSTSLWPASCVTSRHSLQKHFWPSFNAVTQVGHIWSTFPSIWLIIPVLCPMVRCCCPFTLNSNMQRNKTDWHQSNIFLILFPLPWIYGSLPVGRGGHMAMALVDRRALTLCPRS